MSLREQSTFSPAYLQSARELRSNSGQWAAYESRGSCVVLAGPGSGKTKTLTVKLARMLAQEVEPPRGLACVTYNNECVRELKRRLARLGLGDQPNTFVGSVHGFCQRHILMPYAHLASTDLPRSLLVASDDERNVIFRRAFNGCGRLKGSPSHWMQLVELYRRTCPSAEAMRADEEDVARLCRAYVAGLRGANRVDYDDLVLYGLSLVENHHWVRRQLRATFPVMVVDEYQDLGLPLHRLVTCLLEDAGIRFLVVGDPDQSIYGFTGADPTLLRELAEHPLVERVQLRLNYRCGTTIIRASMVALGEERNYGTPDGADQGTVDLYEHPEGLIQQADRICLELIPTILERRPGCTLGDIAVLYLDKNDGDVIAAAADRSGLDYLRVDRNAPYVRTPLIAWIEDCAAWTSGGWEAGDPSLASLLDTWHAFDRKFATQESAYVSRRDLVGFLWETRTKGLMLREWLGRLNTDCLHRLFSPTPPDLVDDKRALDKLIAACSEGGRLENHTVRRFAGQGGDPQHLNLITLYSSKGCEFDVVILMGMENGRIPRASDDEQRRREQRRLFYVGLTRARHEVHITYSGHFVDYTGARYALGPSPFVLELQEMLLQDARTVE